MATLPAATPPPPPSPNPKEEAVKQRLLRHGVVPTPKILHTIRKKEAQKALRRAKKKRSLAQQDGEDPPPQPVDEEEALFRRACREYRALRAMGTPWEKSCAADLRESWDLGEASAVGRLKGERLEELRHVLAERNGERFRWLLDDDVEKEEGGGDSVGEVERRKIGSWSRGIPDRDKIRWLVHKLISTDLCIQDWKFPRLMKQSGLLFSENVLLKILEKLGSRENWKQAFAVVEWVYKEKEYRYSKSRFVYTKLLAVLGKARRPNEALRVFNMMREDGQIYPDMAAYHSIAVTLGQAGLVKEVTEIIECMREKPSKKLRNMRRKDWDPCLEPDIVVHNAVLNACVPTRQWKGVAWVFRQIRQSGQRPTGATYGLAMEVMLESGKCDVVHKLFSTMQRSGLALRAVTYKVLVRAFWREGRVDEAVAAIRDMEQRGIAGAASVYYELACCLCYHGRWKEAIIEIANLSKVPLSKPIEVSFTGMILSSLDGGHIQDCISIFKFMKERCIPNIGTINAMLKVYRHADMFSNAKELFETAKAIKSDFKDSHSAASSLTPDAYSYNTMLEASAAAQQWEYFEHLYKEMTMSSYPLDQQKHAHLLVEASRAGKWYLLEHAFETILEVGEVPRQSLFTEMLCQNLFRENYERAITLVNMMAHASLQVSEKKWTSLFGKNEDRINKDKLEKFLKLLEDGSAVSEDPVCTLIMSLRYTCRGKSLLRLGNLNNVSADELAAGDLKLEKWKADSSKLTIHSVTAPAIPCRNPIDNESSGDSFGGDSQGYVYDKPTPFQTYHAGEGSAKFDPYDGTDSETSVVDDVIESLAGDLDYFGLHLPSASDILEEWEQSRIDDGSLPI